MWAATAPHSRRALPDGSRWRSGIAVAVSVHFAPRRCCNLVPVVVVVVVTADASGQRLAHGVVWDHERGQVIRPRRRPGLALSSTQRELPTRSRPVGARSADESSRRPQRTSSPRPSPARGPASAIQSAVRMPRRVVLDDEHRVAVVAQAAEHGDQLIDVARMECHGRLVQNVNEVSVERGAILTCWLSPLDSIGTPRLSDR